MIVWTIILPARFIHLFLNFCQMTKKLKIAVLYGGKSNEREISLLTGKQIGEALDQEKYEVLFYDTRDELKKLFLDCENGGVDVCFPALHGKWGEDGTIQGMLELLGVKYVGSGVLGSALAMDKAVANRLLTQAGVAVPRGILVTKIDDLQKLEVRLPAVVKPVNSGSSVAVEIVKKREDLERAVKEAFRHDRKVLIEEYIKGIEITVPILGNEKPEALPVIEIVPKREFFDYQAKYEPDFCEEIVPARISEELTRKAQNLGILAHRTLESRGLSRVDMIIGNDDIYVLELNTIPGMTSVSLFPKAAAASGISFPELLDRLIESALE